MTSILGIVASSKLTVSSSYESIATVTASVISTSLTFSSIPSTYKHLEIRGIARDTIVSTTPVGVKMQFNGDTGANYARHNIRGDGANVLAQGNTGFDNIAMSSGSMDATTNSAIYGASIISIIDYASTTKNKTVRSFNGSDANNASANYQVVLNSGLWLSTAAISSITMLPGQVSFAAGTTFALYGIKG